jgi:hypothetical protein
MSIMHYIKHALTRIIPEWLEIILLKVALKHQKSNQIKSTQVMKLIQA